MAERVFCDMSNAAKLAGFSLRHWRRIVDQYDLPIMRIPIEPAKREGEFSENAAASKREKFFMLRRDVIRWRDTKKSEHLKSRPVGRKPNKPNVKRKYTRSIERIKRELRGEKVRY